MIPIASILSVVLLQAPTYAPGVEISEPVKPAVRVLETGDHEILPGVVRPVSQVVMSTSFDTLLGELRVEEGQPVSQGEILAVLDDRVVLAALRVAEVQAQRTAQIERAKVALGQAEDALRRIRKVRDLHAAAEPELIAAEAERDMAAADLRSAQEAHAEALASLELARARHEEHMVRAPFDAIVVRVHAEPGSMVSPGEPLVELVSMGGLCVDLYLPVSVASGLRAGDHYAIAIDDPIPVVVPARIRYIEPRMDPVSRTMRVVFDLDRAEQPARIYAGVLARPATRLPALHSEQGPVTAGVDVFAEPLED